MHRLGMWVGSGVWLLGLPAAAWAAELTIEAGSLTPQERLAVTQAINNVGGVQKIETQEGQVEARLDASAVSAAELQGLVSTLRNTGVPFELKLEGTNLSPSEIAALKDQFAGLPVEVKVETEHGVQEVEIERERPEGNEEQEAKEHHGRQRIEAAERGHHEIERPEAEKAEVERNDVERPEQERVEVEDHEGRQ